jgi:hypothetical protein
MQLKTAVTGQFDISGGSDVYHSQYLTLKAGFPLGSFLLEAGGSVEFAEYGLAGDTLKFSTALAGEFGIYWTLPSSFNSRLSFNFLLASGKTGNNDGDIDAFVPITTKYYSEIFQAKMTALSVLSLNYTARFIEQLGASFTASYFVRNDLATGNSYPVSGTGNGGHWLGAELFCKLIWSPVSDLQLNLGGGIFIPALGDNWPDANPQWKIDLTAILAIF